MTEWDDTVGRVDEYFQDILREPEVLRDSKCLQIVRKALDYFKMSYENKLKYWTQNTKPSRWPQLLAALSYAEVRFPRVERERETRNISLFQKLVECYDFQTESWSVITEKPGHIFGSAMCCLNGETRGLNFIFDILYILHF